MDALTDARVVAVPNSGSGIGVLRGGSGITTRGGGVCPVAAATTTGRRAVAKAPPFDAVAPTGMRTCGKIKPAATANAAQRRKSSFIENTPDHLFELSSRVSV